jgi:hypothetical protein
VHQFRELTLSQDLSEKDLSLYESTSSLATGPDSFNLRIDETSEQLYAFACSLSMDHDEVETGSGVISLKANASTF